MNLVLGSSSMLNKANGNTKHYYENKTIEAWNGIHCYKKSSYSLTFGLTE